MSFLTSDSVAKSGRNNADFANEQAIGRSSVNLCRQPVLRSGSVRVIS